MFTTFETQIAPGVSVHSGVAHILFFSEARPMLYPIRLEVNGTTFSEELPADYQYYYVIFNIRAYTKNNTVYKVPGAGTEQRDLLSMVAVFENTGGTVYITPQTTVAASFAFAQMISMGGYEGFTIMGTNRCFRIAYGMQQNLVERDGSVSSVIGSAPNGGQTNSYGMLNFLSNLFYYCLIDPQSYDSFIRYTYYEGSQGFLSSLMYLVKHPGSETQNIYNILQGKAPVFTPTLTAKPDVWAIAIKFNDSGAANFLISGTAFVAFDKNDRAWITNNFRQGTANSGTHIIVLEPNGKPAPFSPVTGGGLLGTAFGATTNSTKDTIAIGNYGWGSQDYNPTGSVSMFDTEGRAICPTNGYTEYTSRVQGMCYDQDDNLWIASWGSQDPMAPADPPTYAPPVPDPNSSVTVYPKGYGTDPNIKAVTFTDFDGASPHHGTFAVAIDSEGYGIASNAGNGKNNILSSVYKLQLTNNGNGNYTLTKKNSWTSTAFENLRQVSVAPDGYVYVGALLSGRIVKLNPDLSPAGEIKINEVHAPWGINFDKKGMMYVADFGTGQGAEPFGVTVLNPADPSRAYLLNLPTGGEPVTLANGQPLYGTANIACYDPIMRLTATNIDGAGNVWAMNNWKPSVNIDVSSNPGGDGVVVFLGIAEPA